MRDGHSKASTNMNIRALTDDEADAMYELGIEMYVRYKFPKYEDNDWLVGLAESSPEMDRRMYSSSGDQWEYGVAVDEDEASE